MKTPCSYEGPNIFAPQQYKQPFKKHLNIL